MSRPAPATLPPNARVLLIRLSALGDVLFALETLASLKAQRPDVRVDFLVEDRFAEILRGHPQVERVLVYPRRSRWRIPGALRALRRVRYDVVLDLHGILKSALHVAFARARLKLGFAPPGAREGAHRCYHRAVELPRPLPHRAERGAFLLGALGLRAEVAKPVLPPPDRPVDLWRGRARPRVVLHPGTSAFAAFKRWPAERFADLAGRLLRRGAVVAVSHGPGEDALAREVLRGRPELVRCDGEELGLRGLAAAYGEADVVVAADTGPLHIAAAAGTRVIAVFGPKDETLYGPRGDGQRVVFHDVPCRPCTRRLCPAPVCVRGVDVDTVEREVIAALAP